MTDSAPQFAIVPVPKDPGPVRTLITEDAIATGNLSAIL
jgi:hypothetical protein